MTAVINIIWDYQHVTASFKLVLSANRTSVRRGTLSLTDCTVLGFSSTDVLTLYIKYTYQFYTSLSDQVTLAILVVYYLNCICCSQYIQAYRLCFIENRNDNIIERDRRPRTLISLEGGVRPKSELRIQ